MNEVTEVRIDKWLWAVRVYKTRSLATRACQAGHVKVAGQNVKPSRTVRIGDLITAKVGQVTRTIKALGLLERRVGAGVVNQYLEDLTPASEYEKRRETRVQPRFVREKGKGRPTKKERRLWERFRFEE